MIYAFGECELDTQLHELRCVGEPRHLEPQAYDVLSYLLLNRERLVPKEELLDRVWTGRIITPATLNSRLKAVRQAVGDDGQTQHVIRTVRGRGFRFVAPVTAREQTPARGVRRARRSDRAWTGRSSGCPRARAPAVSCE